jgi:hypothetical protein
MVSYDDWKTTNPNDVDVPCDECRHIIGWGCDCPCCNPEPSLPDTTDEAEGNS